MRFLVHAFWMEQIQARIQAQGNYRGVQLRGVCRPDFAHCEPRHVQPRRQGEGLCHVLIAWRQFDHQLLRADLFWELPWSVFDQP